MGVSNRKMKGYEVYVGDKALRVVGEGYAHNFVNAKIEGLICYLDFALKNCSKPFITKICREESEKLRLDERRHKIQALGFCRFP